MYQSEIEQKRIKDFFEKIRVLVFPDEEELVDKTAHKELLKFSTGCSLGGDGRLVVGRQDNSADIRKLCKEGLLSIDRVPPEDDGFQIKTSGQDIIIAGANPRGLLHGVYTFEELLLQGETIFDVFRVPYFRKRSDAIGHYHSISVNLGNDTVDEAKAEYLARLSINQFCACFDCSPFGLHLLDFVKSDVFPFQKEPDSTSIYRLKEMSAVCKKYGIDFILMLWEPVLPEKFAPLGLYPNEVLGKVRRPWGGDKDNMDTTLCVNSPLVRKFYYNLIGKFVREFPDVCGFFFYNLDGSSWLCTPSLCPRCRESLIDSDPDGFNPWETQVKLVSLICDAAHAARRDFTVNFWNPVHFHGEAVKKMYDNAKGYDYVTTGCTGSDHDIYLSNSGEACYEVKQTLEASHRHQAPMYMYFAFNRLEAIQIGFPSPFSVAESLKTFKKWGVSNIMEVTGPTPALNQINAIVMKKFESEPDTDVTQYLKELAVHQFGEKSGGLMYQAWEYAKQAFDCWKNYPSNPLCGSQFIVRISSFYGQVPSEILPPLLKEVENFYRKTLTGAEPWKKEEYERNLTDEFLIRFESMEQKLAQMEQMVQEAVLYASEKERIGICYYEGSFEGLGRPTRKEYALLQSASVRQAHMICRQRVNILHAVKLLRIIRDQVGTEAEAAGKEYRLLLEKDILLQNEYVRLLEELVQKRPCLVLTGICEEELYQYIRKTYEKIENLQKYIENDRYNLEC